MRNGFIRMVQGLFAAALLFQGFEYLQNPSYVISDMPTLYRLSPEHKKANEAHEAKEPPKNPRKAQAPELRLFPDLNEKK